MHRADEPDPAAPSPRSIKRRVAAPRHDFFVAAAPGLERLCRKELLSPPICLPDAQVAAGGVSFQGRLVDLYRASLHLRTANRILMRIAAFRAENFRQLSSGLARVPWPLFLPAGAVPEVRVAARRCRLYHRQAVAERAAQQICDALGRPAADATDPLKPMIFVRGEADRFTVSLDSSGPLLHRRGVKTQPASAPLRETLAAAVLMWAGYRPEEPLVDPMCGSGTFSVEAAMRIRRIPPGWFRRFAFERWPAFAPRQWAFLRKEAEKAFAEPGTVRILSGDLDRRVLPPLHRRLQAFGLDGAAALYCGDFFHLRPPQARTRSGLVVINPPYGRRLGAKTGGGVDLAPLLGHLKRYWKGWKIAVVAPAGLANTVPFAHRRRAMAHGGLSLVVITARL